MIIDGVYRPNITCLRCKQRHPPALSCQEAATYAKAGRKAHLPEGWNFIKCPFCSGHEAVSPEAARLIADGIGIVNDDELPVFLQIELDNIRNTILNYEQREQPATDPLLD